jgi:hypothetical protein
VNVIGSSGPSVILEQIGATAPMTNMTTVPSISSPSVHLGGGNPSQPMNGDHRSPIRPFRLPNNDHQYGMPPPFMVGLHNSSNEGPNMFSPSTSAVGNQGRLPQNLTNTSMLSLRQQMDESNHEMVNMLTQQIGTVFNPLIQTTNDSYQLLANQMGRMTDFFGAPNAPNGAVPNGQNGPLLNVIENINQR